MVGPGYVGFDTVLVRGYKMLSTTSMVSQPPVVNDKSRRSQKEKMRPFQALAQL